MLIRKLSFICTRFLILGTAILLLMGCAFRPQPVAGVRVAGACDVLAVAGGACDDLPMLASVTQDIQKGTGLAVQRVPSTDSLADLKAGRADVALLGREPAAAEMQGLQDSVIAYDAVCLLLDLHTFNGGEQVGTVNGLTQPMSKYIGLQQLTLADLRGFYSNLLRIPGNFWQFAGDPHTYYLTYQNFTDPDTGITPIDPNNPSVVPGDWVFTPVPLQGEMLQAGKYDTQAVLLQKLGIPQSELFKAGISFVPKYFNSEEELLSWRYNLFDVETRANSSLQFDFYILIASRQVTTLAIQHGFKVRPLIIDGQDPIGDPQSIYSGVYPFSRRIHLVTRNPASPAAQTLLKYLLSPAGQQLLARTGYLPLP